MAELYPPGLRIALVNGYNYSDQSRVQRDDVQTGPPRFVLQTTDAPTFVNVTWNFTRLDFQLFEAWFHLSLTDGAKSFTMPLLIGKGLTTVELYFNGSVPYKASYFAKRVKVTTSLLMIDKPFDSQATLDQLLGDINPSSEISADFTVSATMTADLTVA